MIHTASAVTAPPGMGTRDIPRDPASKEYAEFRDRAAYVYITGAFPTHLRSYFTSLLRKITAYHREPVSLDRQMGHMRMEPKVVKQLHLDEHPMVRKASQLIASGYVLDRGDEHTKRRPYGRVNMVNLTTSHRVAVQADGSVRDL